MLFAFMRPVILGYKPYPTNYTIQYAKEAEINCNTAYANPMIYSYLCPIKPVVHLSQVAQPISSSSIPGIAASYTIPTMHSSGSHDTCQDMGLMSHDWTSIILRGCVYKWPVEKPQKMLPSNTTIRARNKWSKFSSGEKASV